MCSMSWIWTSHFNHEGKGLEDVSVDVSIF